MSKRPSSDTGNTTSAVTLKKLKMTTSESNLRQAIEESQKHVLETIPHIEAMVVASPFLSDERKQECSAILSKWLVACVVEIPPVDYLEVRLPNEPLFHPFNDLYSELCRLKMAHRNSLPGPSEYAKNWSQYQDKSEMGLLCLRPPGKRGLPLCTLHDVFRQFRLLAAKEVPHNPDKDAVAATCSAVELCAVMGHSYSTDDRLPDSRGYGQEERGIPFLTCMAGLLGYEFVQQYVLHPPNEAHEGIASGALLEDGCPIILCQIQAEPGAAGDVYMQAVRIYDLAIKVVRANPEREAFFRRGAPMFLICVTGPQLTIAGGFHDGKRTIVEPLGDELFMLEDYTHERQSKLARVLYALAKGVESLRRLIRDRTACAQEYPPSTPQIYETCELYDQTTSTTRQGNLTFLRKLEFPNCSRLFFSASLVTDKTEEVLVKLVPGKYGEEAQRILAEHSLAPKLYGYSRIDGAPTAYVMEYLQPRSWKTLFDHFQLEGVSKPLPAIREAVDLVIGILESHGKVHGDLRSSNIMIEVSDSGEAKLLRDGPQAARINIKVVDFDWAGNAGQARYPQTRNEALDDVRWPGEPGGLIEAGHDCSLVDSWWPAVVS